MFIGKVRLTTLVEGDPKAPFSKATTPRYRGGRYSIPWIAPLYPWSLPYKTECKARRHQFLSLWYDSTYDWTQVSRAICNILTSDPAELSEKKCTCVNNRCIRSKILGDQRITLTVNGLNWVRIVTLARSRWTSNYYITPATGSSGQLEKRCWNENHVPAEAEPPGPRLSSTGERERNAAVARRVGGSICCSSIQSPTHLSQIIPFVTLSNPFK